MTGFPLFAFLALSAAAAPPVAFVPVQPQFAAASDQYRRLWDADGARIVAAMERVTGLPFPRSPVDAIVSEGRPMTAYDGRTIRLRASYSPAYKKATLVHELGHRLALTFPRRDGLDDHRLLDLFLYDVWTDLYGQAFADRMVAIERRIGPAYDAAWSWALAMTREQRQARLAALRKDPVAHGNLPTAVYRSLSRTLSYDNRSYRRYRCLTTWQTDRFPTRPLSG